MRLVWPGCIAASLFCALLPDPSQAAPTRGITIVVPEGSGESAGAEKHDHVPAPAEESAAPGPVPGPDPAETPDPAPAVATSGAPSAITVIEPEPEIVETVAGGKVRMALVLGMSGYESVPELANTANDARLVSGTLRSIGFRVWRGIDLTHFETLDAIRSFVAASAEADLVTFYFAGHAVQVGGRNYLFPVDVVGDSFEALLDRAIDMSSVIGLMESNPATNIVILDACRDNPFGDDIAGFAAARDKAGIGLARMSARAGTLIAYAAAPEQVAFDGSGENSPFSSALARHMPTRGLPLELVLVRVRQDVLRETAGNQVPWSNSSLIRELTLVPDPEAAADEGTAVAGRSPDDDDADWSVPEELAAFLADTPELEVNGRKVALRTLGRSAELTLRDKLVQGLNHLEAGTRRMKVWLDGQSAFVFPRDYDSSHALIIAIDDYPPGSGFQKLGFMEDHARALAAQLKEMGFPEENVVELYGAKATHDGIADALDNYWGQRPPGRHDRLLIYYGGHGTHIARTTGSDTVPEVPDGLLIPYDFDPAKPYRTGLLLEEIDSRNLKRSAFHHTLLLIDACSSGLIMRQYQGQDPDEKPATLTPSERWLRIKSSLENPQTAVIVAGTGEERALWENGGVFTKTLIEGLSGAADINQDGIINYDELQFHLSDRVRFQTAQVGVQQSPASFEFGSGRFLFERKRF